MNGAWMMTVPQGDMVLRRWSAKFTVFLCCARTADRSHSVLRPLKGKAANQRVHPEKADYYWTGGAYEEVWEGDQGVTCLRAYAAKRFTA